MKENSQNIECQRPLSNEEKNVIQKLNNKKKMDLDIFRTTKSEEGEKPRVEPIYAKDLSQENAKLEYEARIMSATGSPNEIIGLDLLASACEALSVKSESLENSIRDLNIFAHKMRSHQPQDEIEGQLIAQLIVLHEKSMSLISRSTKTDRVDFANIYINAASKLLTRHHETLSALLKYRRGGEQRVHVEHVHVHDGGRAIVGSIGSGGGLNQKNEEGPHAKV